MLERFFAPARRFALPLLACAMLAFAPLAGAKEAVPASDDPALEARVMGIAEELRCLVCQNETIAASNAELAVDLRKQIRVQLVDGRSQQEILDYMVARYGDFVLYRPRLKPVTVLLWVGPFVLLAFAAGMLVVNVRRRRRSVATEEWSQAQAQRARDLLDDKSGNP